MTRNKLYSSILLLLLVPFAIRAQVDITRDAYSVVQNATTEIICESATSALFVLLTLETISLYGIVLCHRLRFHVRQYCNDTCDVQSSK